MSSTSRIHLAIVLSALVPSWGGMALHAQAPVPGAHPLPKERIELSADVERHRAALPDGCGAG